MSHIRGSDVVERIGSVEYDDFFKCADTARYERKNMGRDGVGIYDRHDGR